MIKLFIVFFYISILVQAQQPDVKPQAQQPNVQPQVQPPDVQPQVQPPDIQPQAQPEDIASTKDPNLGGDVDDEFSQLEAEILSYLEPYTYDTESRRDPFQPYKFEETPDVQLPIAGAEDDEKKIKVSGSSILNYNLQQLQLKAILWDVNSPKIIVQDPNRKQHILKLNDKIGNGNGYVAAVREGEVVIVQKIRARGKTLVYTKYMHLKR